MGRTTGGPGHHAANRTLTELDQRGIVLGAFDEITLGEEAVALAPGDLLLLYTDGLTDALNADGEMFGEERLRTLVAAHAAASAQELLWAITGAVAGFIGGAEQADDVTGVVVRWG
jgi:sigma-B regulation protein RsbU (phosphoserine phosphatase)